MSKTKLFLLFFIFTTALIVSYPDSRSAAVRQAKDDKAPLFTLKLLSGEHFTSADLTGKVAVLKFVSSY
jgi:cytochrome oxidase Cu insertion factor (SCO1/SenC/PrrC family)